ncbi:MAG: hypothetical protein ACJ8BW_06625 [Ktedonobacteraceae bacterium]
MISNIQEMINYALIFLALLFLLMGGVALYVGVIQMQQAKAQREHIPWWKQPFIVFGLACGATGVLILAYRFLTYALITNQTNIVLAVVVGILFILLSLGLYIYAIVLALRQTARTNNLSNRRGE